MEKEYVFLKVVKGDEIYVSLPDKSGMMLCLSKHERDSFMAEAHLSFDDTVEGIELIDYLSKLMAIMEKFLTDETS